MVYLNNIPQPTDDPATQSQAQLLENFGQLDTQFAIDHIAFSVGGADQGKHKKIQFDTNNAAGAPAGTQSEIYTSGASPQPYFHNANLTAQMGCILAWCRFDGSGATPIAITSGYNVTNVTKLSTTSYTINFINALPNANYAVFINSGAASVSYGGILTSVPPAVNNATIVMSVANLSFISVLVIGN